MPTRKTLLKAKAGVRLERIENLSARGKLLAQHYVLKTLRRNQPRVLTNEGAAEDAFDLEVVASLLDPVVSRLTTDD